MLLKQRLEDTADIEWPLSNLVDDRGFSTFFLKHSAVTGSIDAKDQVLQRASS